MAARKAATKKATTRASTRKTTTKKASTRSSSSTRKQTKITLPDKNRSSQRMRSAVGIAQYSFLGDRADDSFNNKPRHKVTVVFDPKDTEFKAMLKTITAWEKEWVTKDCTFNYDGTFTGLREFEDKKNPDSELNGRPSITFTTNARENDTGGYEHVPCVDVYKNEVDANKVWSGDVIRVAFSLGGWAMSTQGGRCGAKPYLNAVQVVEKRSGNGEATDVFEAEEDEIDDAFGEVDEDPIEEEEVEEELEDDEEWEYVDEDGNPVDDDDEDWEDEEI